MQVASALAARHIGGAVNYVGVADTLSISASAQASGLAADSLICAFYFAGLFQLASKIGPEPEVDLAAVGQNPSATVPTADKPVKIGIQVRTKFFACLGTCCRFD